MVKLFKMNEAKKTSENEGTLDNPLLPKEKVDLFKEGIAALLNFLKDFALNIEELRVDHYHGVIDGLAHQFASSAKPKKAMTYFDIQKPKIQQFIEAQHKYVDAREKELRDIIDLLTKAMASLTNENQEFYQHVHNHGEKILELSLLDDIKKIRQSLQHEVEKIYQMVQSKRDLEKRQIELLSDQVSELKQELENVKVKSQTDGLTGAFNRSALDEYLAERIKASRKAKFEFCLLLLDLDDFKSLNDTHGHLIGDRMLMAFAQKCRASIRSDDYFARYGGEEFAIVLNHITLRDGLNKASSICKAVANARYATDENQADDFLSITVSIGVTPYHRDDTVESLIARADKALYDAKRKGKNMAVGRKA